MPVSCAAVLCVRNEAKHIHRAISDFVNQGIDVVVIDDALQKHAPKCITPIS